MRWTSLERLTLADEVERVVRDGLDLDLHVLALDLVALFERVTLPDEDNGPLLQSHVEHAREVLREHLTPTPPLLELRVWSEASSDSRAGLLEVRSAQGVWDEPVETGRCVDWTTYQIDPKEFE
jgi:hypothetical protein